MKNISNASTLSFRAAVLFIIAGMFMGIGMAASHDHALAPAHAHINLVGWVSLFLIGIFYRLHPDLDASKPALLQVAVWIVGTAIMTSGVTAIYLGQMAGEPFATIGSIILLLDMLFFAYLVFQAKQPAESKPAFAPAE